MILHAHKRHVVGTNGLKRRCIKNRSQQASTKALVHAATTGSPGQAPSVKSVVQPLDRLLFMFVRVGMAGLQAAAVEALESGDVLP